jgi:hypothetical protein
MNELAGGLLLAGGFGALTAGAGLASSCLRLRSPIEFLLATYVLAWTSLVALTLALSPPGLLIRGWLVTGIGVAVLAAVAAWLKVGRPRPPAFGPALNELRRALERPAVLVLFLVVIVGAAYSVALAFFTPANDGDALAYHLARAAFWRQEHGLGYTAGVPDLRVNVDPPNGEIGQLSTMLLSGSDRYVALPQLAAYAALVLCVARLGRHVGLGAPEAIFGALAFATLPVVVLQSSAPLNDLVVASFLLIAAVFALRAGRVSLVLFALALGLALGTKFTAVLALPTLAFVIAVGQPLRRWLALALAGLGGLALGSVWYAFNLVETGSLDGGLAESGDQRIAHSVSAVVPNAMQLALDFVDMSGAMEPHSRLFLVAAGVLLGLGLFHLRRSMRDALAFILAAVATGGVLLATHVEAFGQRSLDKAWAVLGKPELAPFDSYLELNVTADPVESWYGPLGALIVVGGLAVVTVLWLRGHAPTLAVALAVAPWMFLLTLAATVVWDPFRGRFLVFGIAMAAATWGMLLRFPVVRLTTAAVGATALVLTLANYLGKPSGLAEIWPQDEIHVVTVNAIWGAARPDAQARLRPEQGEESVYRYLEHNVPADAHIAVAPRENDFLSPYFGPRLSHHVSLASRTRAVSEDAEWLVLAPAADARRCRAAWRRVRTFGSGWRIERRVNPGCRVAELGAPALAIGRDSSLSSPARESAPGRRPAPPG